VKRRLDERSPLEKGLIGLLFVVSLALVGLAERDIQARPDEEIRGPKLAWRAASLNAFGAPAYLGLGRRQRPGDPVADPTAISDRSGVVGGGSPRRSSPRGSPHPRVLLTEATRRSGPTGSRDLKR
jgi:hypothetical protein